MISMIVSLSLLGPSAEDCCLFKPPTTTRRSSPGRSGTVTTGGCALGPSGPPLTLPTRPPLLLPLTDTNSPRLNSHRSPSPDQDKVCQIPDFPVVGLCGHRALDSRLRHWLIQYPQRRSSASRLHQPADLGILGGLISAFTEV
jgi:hypothetical protein